MDLVYYLLNYILHLLIRIFFRIGFGSSVLAMRLVPVRLSRNIQGSVHESTVTCVSAVNQWGNIMAVRNASRGRPHGIHEGSPPGWCKLRDWASQPIRRSYRGQSFGKSLWGRPDRRRIQLQAEDGLQSHECPDV